MTDNPHGVERTTNRALPSIGRKVMPFVPIAFVAVGIWVMAQASTIVGSGDLVGTLTNTADERLGAVFIVLGFAVGIIVTVRELKL